MAENLLDTCTDCPTFQVSGCTTGINIKLGFDYADTTVYMVLTDKFGKQYEETLTTDVDGIAAIDLGWFPDGFFNPYAGDMSIQIYTDDTKQTPITTCPCLVLEMIESNYTDVTLVYCYEDVVE